MAGKSIPVLVGEKEELLNITVSDKQYLQIMTGGKLINKIFLSSIERDTEYIFVAPEGELI